MSKIDDLFKSAALYQQADAKEREIGGHYPVNNEEAQEQNSRMYEAVAAQRKFTECAYDALPELRALLAERDALREALTACVAYMKDVSGGYETYKATLEHAESILNAALSEGERLFIRNGEKGTGGTQQEGWIEVTNIQKATGSWAEKTFPLSTPESVINHFKEEANEFVVGNAEKGQLPGDPEEAADCFLLLCHHAYKKGYDLVEEACKKLRKNMKRQWDTKPNAEGYFKHKEESYDHQD